MSVVWMPLSFYGETFYQCTVTWDALVAQATSRSKDRALMFALEELARLVGQRASAQD